MWIHILTTGLLNPSGSNQLLVSNPLYVAVSPVRDLDATKAAMDLLAIRPRTDFEAIKEEPDFLAVGQPDDFTNTLH
jgi:hypothetical protein